jgi:hypothetical protein
MALKPDTDDRSVTVLSPEASKCLREYLESPVLSDGHDERIERAERLYAAQPHITAADLFA